MDHMTAAKTDRSRPRSTLDLAVSFSGVTEATEGSRDGARTERSAFTSWNLCFPHTHSENLVSPGALEVTPESCGWKKLRSFIRLWVD